MLLKTTAFYISDTNFRKREGVINVECQTKNSKNKTE